MKSFLNQNLSLLRSEMTFRLQNRFMLCLVSRNGQFAVAYLLSNAVADIQNVQIKFLSYSVQYSLISLKSGCISM